MLKVLLWSFTPKSKRGQIPKRPLLTSPKTFVTVLVILTVIASVMTYKEHIKVYTGNITLKAFWGSLWRLRRSLVKTSHPDLVVVYTKDAEYC